MLGFGLWWLGRAERAARRAGEGYGALDSTAVDTAADDPVVRELATTAREFDPAEIHRGQHGDTKPPIARAFLPLVVLVSFNLLMSLFLLPRLDFSFLAEERWGSTSLSAVAGVWSVVVALASAIATLIAVNYRYFPALARAWTQVPMPPYYRPSPSQASWVSARWWRRCPLSQRCAIGCCRSKGARSCRSPSPPMCWRRSPVRPRAVSPSRSTRSATRTWSLRPTKTSIPRSCIVLP